MGWGVLRLPNGNRPYHRIGTLFPKSDIKLREYSSNPVIGAIFLLKGILEQGFIERKSIEKQVLIFVSRDGQIRLVERKNPSHEMKIFISRDENIRLVRQNKTKRNL